MLKKIILSTAILASSNAFAAQLPGHCKDINTVSRTADLRMSSANYIALNESSRVYGYQKINANSSATLKFSSSEDGLFQTTNRRNSYHTAVTSRFGANVLFNSPYSRGKQYVWVENNKETCVYKEVSVQNSPTLSFTSTSGGLRNPISATAHATIDQYSLFGEQGKSPQYTWTFKNISVGGVPAKTINTGSTPSVTYRPDINGDYKITVRVSDGTYSVGKIAYVYYTGGSNGGNTEIY